jgi:hypothetical protein
MPRLSAPLLTLLLLAPWTCHAATDPESPACDTPQHAGFDFWIGDWDVYLPDGSHAGTNHIERILGGCVVYESWQSARSGFAGRSFNTYDTASGRWSQVWVDSDGNTIHFSGRRHGNVMSMTATHATGKGTVYYRMSYTVNDDGTLRQLWRQSRDRRTWDVLFDGQYRRRTVVGRRGAP